MWETEVTQLWERLQQRGHDCPQPALGAQTVPGPESDSCPGGQRGGQSLLQSSGGAFVLSVWVAPPSLSLHGSECVRVCVCTCVRASV